MNERIKSLRKALELTQQEFANKLRVPRSNVAAYELGVNALSDAVIALICVTFNVSETWLRTGEGEVFDVITPDEEIASFVGRVLANRSDSIQKHFMAMLSRLSDDGWELLENMAKEIYESKNTVEP